MNTLWKVVYDDAATMTWVAIVAENATAAVDKVVRRGLPEQRKICWVTKMGEVEAEIGYTAVLHTEWREKG